MFMFMFILWALMKSQREKISLILVSFSVHIISFPSMLIFFFVLRHLYLHFERKISCRSAGVALCYNVIKKSLTNSSTPSKSNVVIQTLTWPEYHVVLARAKCKQKQNNMNETWRKKVFETGLYISFYCPSPISDSAGSQNVIISVSEKNLLDEYW